MAVGSLVTEGLGAAPSQREASPFIIWEWLVVEALVRTYSSDDIWGVPGTSVTRRALEQHNYLDARSYLKTPRIFGFHGVYKRLANQSGLLTIQLAPGPYAEGLVDAWARDLGYRGIRDAKPVLSRWSAAVRRCLSESSPRTKPGWSNSAWAELAGALAPSKCKAREKRYLRDLLNATGDRQLGALPKIWQLQTKFNDDSYREELLHVRLKEQERGYEPLIKAIQSYEAFARSLQDSFEVLKGEATHLDARGFLLPQIADEKDFRLSVSTPE
jgi:hypothetical protein